MALEVLVVDDEADIRELVSGVLEDEGYAVRSAADSSAALDAMQKLLEDLDALVARQSRKRRRPKRAGHERNS